MTEVKETTLEEFKTRAHGHVASEKTGVTLCYRGLSESNKFRARQWLRAEALELRRLATTASLHLQVERWKALRETADAYDELRIRLGVIR